MSGNFSLMDIAVQFKKATKHCPCKIKNHPSLMGGFLFRRGKNSMAEEFLLSSKFWLSVAKPDENLNLIKNQFAKAE